MSYNNLSVQVTSTTGTWNGSSFSYSSIALDSGIPDLDQIEVERIFDLTTITTDTSGAAIPAIASNITTVDLRKIYLLAKTNYTLNQTTHSITGFSITSTSKTFTFTGGGALNGKIIYIPPVTNGQQLTVRRKTYSLGAYVTWVAGTRLTSEQLNGQVTQLVKIVQELLYKLDSEFVKKTDFLATDAANLQASSNINMVNNYIVGLPTSGTYLTGYAVPMDYVNNMGFRHGVITKDTTPTNAGTDINIAATSTEGRSGIWFDPEDGRLKVYAGNAWVVATAASRGPGVVQLTGTQSISGLKTFLNTVTMDQSASISSNLTVGNDLTVATNLFHVDAFTTNVGIGITNPARQLQIHEAAANTPNYISLTNANSGSAINDGLRLGTEANNTAYLWNSENSALVFGTNNTEQVRIKETGEVGIGTATPVTGSLIHTHKQTGNLSHGIRLTNANTGQTNSDGFMPHIGTSGEAYIWQFENQPLIFATDNTDRMRITSGGAVLIGPTSPIGTANTSNPRGLTIDSPTNSGNYMWFTGGNAYCMYLESKNAATTGYLAFINQNGTTVGSISSSGGTTTTYTTTSDYRLKSNISPITNSLSKVSSLKPCSYSWISDNTFGEGFIAHELQEVIPYAVVGKKDAIKEDGSIDPQQVDLSKVVPLLTAAIQELKAIVDAQAQRIAVLEGAINA